MLRIGMLTKIGPLEYLKNLEQKIPAKRIVLNAKNLKKFDASILVTDHDNFNYKKILKYSKFLMDTRGKFKSVKNKKILFA